MITIEIPQFSRGSALKGKLNSVQLGVVNPGTRGPSGPGNVLPTKEIFVVRDLDEHATEFIKRAVHGPEFPTVVIRFNKPDGRSGMAPFLEIILTSVLVASYHVAHRDSPEIAMTFNFSESEVKHV